jgi:hypothetical protein
MSEKIDKQHKAQELKNMIKDRKPSESVEEVLVKYCHRHGISVDDCRVYYDKLVKSGDIKEK